MNNIEDKQIWSATKAWFNSLSPDVQWGDLSEPERVGAREMYLEDIDGENPSVESIYDHLVNDNDWTEEEFQDFMKANERYVFQDGRTKLSHNTWEWLAQNAPKPS